MQCKQLKAFNVGVSTVRELYEVMATHRAPHGFVVTSGQVTQKATAFCQRTQYPVMDGPALMQLLQDSRKGDTAHSTSASSPAAPRRRGDCAIAPSSGGASAVESRGNRRSRLTHVRKTHGAASCKRGAAPGKAFWGCSNDSGGCRGTREIRET